MKFKYDKFKNARGGYSRFLEIKCRKCDRVICKYQKDGPGNLRRLYIDRILEPAVNISTRLLVCDCGETLGMKIVYKKEARPAYRLFVDAVLKKVVKSA